MRNLTGLLMIIACDLLALSLLCNTYAFSYEISKSSPRLLKSYENLYDEMDLYERYSYSYGYEEEDNNIDSEPSKKILRPNGYIRAAIETTAVLGMVSAYYWGTKAYTSDFDYDVSLKTLKKKFSGEAIRFDDNTIGTNSFLGHPLSGSYYYLIARDNDISRIESFLWSSVVSAIHEYFIEFPEVASINDLITTPVAGSAIGEAMYQLGRYFRCAKNGNLITHKIMSVIMDPVALVNDWIWHGINMDFFEQGRCYSSPLQGEFNIFSGISSIYRENTSRFNTGFEVGFHGKVYPLPEYG